MDRDKAGTIWTTIRDHIYNTGHSCLLLAGTFVSVIVIGIVAAVVWLLDQLFGD